MGSVDEGAVMLLNELTKKEVLDVNANKVGYLVDVDLDVSQAIITNYIIRVGVFKRVHLAPSAIDKVGEKILLKISKEELEQTPAGVK